MMEPVMTGLFQPGNGYVEAAQKQSCPAQGRA
jgi:hypothetical protein